MQAPEISGRFCFDPAKHMEKLQFLSGMLAIEIRTNMKQTIDSSPVCL
jgi:hypothetical protein